MKKIVMFIAVAAFAGLSHPVAAQIYIPPQCDIDTKHFLVRQASLYVKSAAEARDAEKRNQALDDAFRTVDEAVARGEDTNWPVWYFAGRAHLVRATATLMAADSLQAADNSEGVASAYESLRMDLHAADSALTKVEENMSDCVDDVDTHRYQIWVPIFNSGVEFLQNSDMENALERLTTANIIYHKEPYVPFYAGNVHAQLDHTDSAIVYFRETRDLLDRMFPDGGAASDSGMGQYQETYDISIYNIARLYHRSTGLALQEQDEAQFAGDSATAEALEPQVQMLADSSITYYQAYRELHPEDLDARNGLASVYEIAGRSDAATALYDEMLGDPANSTWLQLFQAGVSSFQADNYEMAIRAFSAGLEKNRLHRDGLYNLTQSYFAIANPYDQGDEEPSAEEMARRTDAAGRMLEVALRLAEVDFQNEESMQLMAAAYQLNGMEDSTIAVLTRLQDMQFDISVLTFQETEMGANISLQLRNRMEAEIEVPELVFDFVDAEGTVITTETVSPRRLGPEEATSVDVTPMGEGISAWTYRVTQPEG